MSLKVRVVLIVLLLIAGGVLTLQNYSFLFKKTIVGEISDVKQIDHTTMIMSGSQTSTPSQRYSFAIAIKNGQSGEIFTSSTDDRQWAVAKVGQCAIAEFYPYPPWNFEKNGTFHNARLTLLCESCEVGKCGEEMAKKAN